MTKISHIPQDKYQELISIDTEHRTILYSNESNTKQLTVVTSVDRIGKIIAHYEVGKPDEKYPYKTAYIKSAIDFFNDLIG